MQQDARIQPMPARFRLSAEFQLLLACSWLPPASFSAAQLDRIRAFCREPIDWKLFLSLLDRHKLASIAFAMLDRQSPPAVPAQVSAEIKSRKLRDWKAAMLYASELAQLNREFLARGVDLLPLKGISLSLRLFDDPGMRHVRDLDLLIRPDDVDQADDILIKKGYRRIHPELQTQAGRKKLQLRYERHLEYLRDDLQLRVELHWRWEMLSAPRVADLWRHTYLRDWQGTHIRMLQDDVLLLTLCDHGAGHRFMRLKWLSDCVMMLVAQSHSSLHRTLELARYFDMERPLAQVTLLAGWLYGIDLPEPLVRLAQNEKSAARLASQAIEAICRDVKDLQAPHRHLSFFQYTVSSPVRYVESFRYAMSLRKKSRVRGALSKGLIRSIDFRTLPLPDRLVWLYYPLRPFLWIWRHATRSTR